MIKQLHISTGTEAPSAGGDRPGKEVRAYGMARTAGHPAHPHPEVAGRSVVVAATAEHPLAKEKGPAVAAARPGTARTKKAG